MLPLWITCVIVLPVLALVFYVVRRSKPGRFRLSATLLKLVSINIEVDAQDNRMNCPRPPRMPPRTQLRITTRPGKPGRPPWLARRMAITSAA